MQKELVFRFRAKEWGENMRTTIGKLAERQLTGWRVSLIVTLVMAAAASLPAQTKTDGHYTATSNAVFSFIDLVSSGGSSSVLSNTDDGVALLTLPFSFKFYGTSYTQVCVSSNGLVLFVTSAAACVPSADFANVDLS